MDNRSELRKLTDDYIRRGGKITQCPPATNSEGGGFYPFHKAILADVSAAKRRRIATFDTRLERNARRSLVVAANAIDRGCILDGPEYTHDE